MFAVAVSIEEWRSCMRYGTTARTHVWNVVALAVAAGVNQRATTPAQYPGR